MKKSILALLLVLITAFSLPTTSLAATKASTKTLTYDTYTDAYIEGDEATVKITKVTSQKTKDFEFYLSDDDKTISKKGATVIYSKAPTTITLQPNKGEDFAAVQRFSITYDSNKVKSSTIKDNIKFYGFDYEDWYFITSKKLDTKPEGYCLIANSSTQKLTKAGTYVLYTEAFVPGLDSDEPMELNPIFIVVSEDDTKETKVTSLTLNKTKATLTKGKTTTLKVTAKPSDATNKAVTWKSSNTKIATVDKNGKVKAVKKGTVTITATAKDGSGKKVTCKVTVK